MDCIIKKSEVSSTSLVFKGVKIVESLIGENCSIGDYSSIYKSHLRGGNIINRNCSIDRSSFGFGSYVNQNTIVKNVEIGRFCCISWNVTLYGGSSHNYLAASTFSAYHWNYLFHNHANNGELEDKKKTTIGNDVWIGNGAIIIGGVTIGDGAVIGAGAVVTKDVEPYSVIVGVPAKTIRKRFDDRTISELLKIQWWNWPLDVIRENEMLLRINELNSENLELMKNISDSL